MASGTGMIPGIAATMVLRAPPAHTKAAQMALARSWAEETVNTGPQVQILTPMPMATATRARFFPGEDRAALASPAEEAARLVGQIAAG